jgi:hypothetical protein
MSVAFPRNVSELFTRASKRPLLVILAALLGSVPQRLPSHADRIAQGAVVEKREAESVVGSCSKVTMLDLLPGREDASCVSIAPDSDAHESVLLASSGVML